MIQRIQSLWLLLAATCAVFTFRLSFFSGNRMGENNMPVFEKLVASSSFVIMIFTALLIGGCLVLIFLYKNRKQQLWLTVAALGVSVINIILYFRETKTFVPGQGNYDLTSVIAFSIPVWLVLALRGIWSDEKLVKSLDRLR